MLLKAETLDRIARGEIDLVFRRWRRASVRQGGRLRTARGELRIGGVEVVDDAALSSREAERAGFPDLASLRASLTGREGQLHRIEVLGLAADERIALRSERQLSTDAFPAILRKLERWDEIRRPGYGLALLKAIAVGEGVPAGDIAVSLGEGKATLKRDVRELKEMGLTESLKTGYRLAPRGKAVVERLEDG